MRNVEHLILQRDYAIYYCVTPTKNGHISIAAAVVLLEVFQGYSSKS